MRRSVGVILFVLLTFVTGQARSIAAPASALSLPAPCIINGPEVYLVINHQLRHIIDWDTFLNLGYQQPDIVPCGAATNYAEGAPITRLFKGSDVRVYYLENGFRRHIPDMDTFKVLGFYVSDITVLPDNLLSLWPLGDPLPPQTIPPDQLLQPLTIGVYTIWYWQPPQGYGRLHNYAIISAPNQNDIRVEGVEAIGQLPAPDITGEGHPDLMFRLARYGSRCCEGTLVFDLGPVPTQVLEVRHPYGTYGLAGGAGIFQDLNQDGVYEFITDDGVDAPCSTPSIKAVLAFDPNQRRYVGASPQFSAYYASYFQQLADSAHAVPETREHYGCEARELVQTLLYLGKVQEARSAFDHLYAAPDAEEYWNSFVEGVKRGEFYVSP